MKYLSILSQINFVKSLSYNLEYRLTLRYLTGLVFIAFTLLSSHFVFSHQITSNEKDAYLINVSGMQRMLSQRIALMAREIYHAETKAEAQIYVDKLREVTTKFQENHKALTTGQLDTGENYILNPALEKAYFGQIGIDPEVREYTQLSLDLLKRYDEGGLGAARSSQLHKDIVSIARNGFLNRLNNIVLIYEKQAQEKVFNISLLSKIILAIGTRTYFFFSRPYKNCTKRC